MPRIVDHDAYRAELLDGCSDLFADVGYASLSMRAVAGALGVSTGTLYHYFPSKRDLFLRVVEHLTARVLAGLGDALAGAPTRRAAVQRLLAHLAAHEVVYARYNRVCLDHLRAPVEGGDSVMADTTAACVHALAEGLRLDEAHARFVFVALMGLVIQRGLDGGATPLDEQTALLARWLDRPVAG